MITGSKQSGTMSFVEASTNVVVGYLLAVLVQMIAFPMFGLVVSLTGQLGDRSAVLGGFAGSELCAAPIV